MPKMHAIDNDWQMSEAISADRKLRPLDSNTPDGNQIRANEVVWLQLHSYRLKPELYVGKLQPELFHRDMFAS